DYDGSVRFKKSQRILHPDLYELVASADGDVELELLEHRLQHAVELCRGVPGEGYVVDLARLREHGFEQRRKHRDVRVAETDRPGRLLRQALRVDVVLQLRAENDTHPDRHRLDQRAGKIGLDDDRGGAAGAQDNCYRGRRPRSFEREAGTTHNLLE